MILTIVTICFWIGLWLSNSFIEPKLSVKQLVIVAFICSILAFVPEIGFILAIVAGTILIYRLSDLSWGNSFGIMVLARGIAVLIGIAVSLYVEQRLEETEMTIDEQVLELLNTQSTNNEQHVTNQDMP